MEDSQKTGVAQTQSPLFKPEFPAPDVPIMAQPDTSQDQRISSYIRRLRAIGDDAKAAIESWKTSSPESIVPTKRKGMHNINPPIDFD